MDPAELRELVNSSLVIEKTEPPITYTLEEALDKLETHLSGSLHYDYKGLGKAKKKRKTTPICTMMALRLEVRYCGFRHGTKSTRYGNSQALTQCYVSTIAKNRHSAPAN